MKHILAFLTAMLLLVPTAPVLAQQQQQQRGFGQFLDTLSGLLGQGYQRWHGNVVYEQGSDLIFRADNGQVYKVDMAAVDPGVWQGLQAGQPVSLAAKAAAIPHTLIARGVQADQNGARQSYQTAQGTVESVNGDQMTFRTVNGQTLPVNLSQVQGAVTVQPNEQATLVYEQQGAQQVTALWLAPGTASTAQMPRGQQYPQTAQPGQYGQYPQTGQSPQGQSPQGGQYGQGSPSASAQTGSFERLHGYVQSIGVDTMWLKTDQGGTVQVDTSRVPMAQRQSLQPGALVSVTGRMAGANQFSAELIQQGQ